MNTKKLTAIFIITAACSIFCSNCYCLKVASQEISFKSTFEPKIWINSNIQIGIFKNSKILSGPSKLKKQWDYSSTEINEITKKFLALDKKYSNIFTKLTDIIKNKTLSREERLDLFDAWNSDLQTQNFKSKGILAKETIELKNKYFTLQQKLYRIFVETQYPAQMIR